ncbi:MAG: methylated-DNA--[protein]-cysteine S-methyltransferase [Deltaproteobacteria bacterium]|nr:methylated-DNA--[protein]-cysteine S-methyltransferase [Deltaproteobacteria bacterium]
MEKVDFSQKAQDYQRIERAIRYLEAHFREQPGLDEIAAAVNLSKFHFQRLFKRWAGVTPAQFLQVLTLKYTKEKLAESRSLLDTSFDAGLSGAGRLHDLFVSIEAMTPGEFKRMGEGLRIEFGFHSTPFGECLLALTQRGICHLGFVEDQDRGSAFAALQDNWPRAVLRENLTSTGALTARIFSPGLFDSERPFHLLLKGTNFQIQVWRALLKLPRGEILSYRDIAVYLGRPPAVRAVANAIAHNPIAYLIPCHRVIATSGIIHQYRWGCARKKALIALEALAGS